MTMTIDNHEIRSWVNADIVVVSRRPLDVQRIFRSTVLASSSSTHHALVENIYIKRYEKPKEKQKTGFSKFINKHGL